jgi:hypothetical protein
VTTPDGTEWKVRAFRVRLPPWRQIDTGRDAESADYDIFGIILNVIVLPVTLLVIPLAIALFEFPIAVARSAFSRVVWVEAATSWPVEEHFLWRTTRADAPGVHAAVAAQLSAGDVPRPGRAELVERPGE